MLQRMASNLKSNLSNSKAISRQFSSAFRNDYVQISESATVGDVFQSMEKEVRQRMPTQVQDESHKILSKYQDKLEKAAQSKGYNSVDEMLLAQKKERQTDEKQKARLAEEQQNNQMKLKGDETSKSSTYAQSLNDIFDLEKIKEEPKQRIEEIWNFYHSTKNAISAGLDSLTFQKLKARSKECPIVKIC